MKLQKAVLLAANFRNAVENNPCSEKLSLVTSVHQITYLTDPVDFTHIKRVLVIKLQHLGDVLLTTPLYQVLKESYPHLSIDALIYQETLPILQHHPLIEQIHCIDRQWKKNGKFYQFRQELRLLGKLRQRRYDLIINLTDRWRGAMLTRWLKPAYSVSQPYAHRRGKFWRRSFTHIYRIPKTYRHTVETELDALRRLGLQPKTEQKALHFALDDASHAKAQQFWQTHQLSGEKVVVIHPTSRWMFKAWHSEGFADVINTLQNQHLKVILISGPDQAEMDYVAQIAGQLQSPCLDLSGQLTLHETGALIKEADLFIGLDSVAMHIAAAVETPCIVLFGPSKDEVWHPWAQNYRIISNHVSCRPCDLKGCGDGLVSDCLQMIRPGQVLQAVNDLLC